jgi:hypothetical protein
LTRFWAIDAILRCIRPRVRGERLRARDRSTGKVARVDRGGSDRPTAAAGCRAVEAIGRVARLISLDAPEHDRQQAAVRDDGGIVDPRPT